MDYLSLEGLLVNTVGPIIPIRCIINQPAGTGNVRVLDKCYPNSIYALEI